MGRPLKILFLSACQCNGHSRCVNQSICEKCENLTTGKHCETCISGFYGDRSPDNGPCPHRNCILAPTDIMHTVRMQPVGRHGSRGTQSTSLEAGGEETSQNRQRMCWVSKFVPFITRQEGKVCMEEGIAWERGKGSPQAQCRKAEERPSHPSGHNTEWAWRDLPLVPNTSLQAMSWVGKRRSWMSAMGGRWGDELPQSGL